MNNNEPDLDLSNYDLHDILRLFQIPENFNEADMKKAKRKVLSLHPDKSRLDSSYFLFYSKAYKMLYSVFEFNNRADKSGGNVEEYIPLETSDSDKKEALSVFFDKNKTLKKAQNFNNWFNKEFDKQKITSDQDDAGYGSWLTSDADVSNEAPVQSMSAMGERFAKKKQEVRSLVVRKDVGDMYSGNSANSADLVGVQLDNYSSDMFSSVQFQDLKQAHVESVIPVTDEDYQNVPKFNNVNELMIHRNTQGAVPLSEQQALQYLSNREKEESEMSSSRAFELAKQTETAKEKSQEFWAGIMKIRN